MRRTDSFEKMVMMGKIEGKRRRGPQRMKWLDGITDSMDMTLGKLRGRIGTPPGNSLLSDVGVEETILCLKDAH